MTTEKDGGASPSRPPRPWLDVALGALGLVFGWSSLTFPFGRDQGLYYYVAREWVRHGSIPYRDVFDHKPPGIYILHAVTLLLFGDHMWSIRIAELLGVVVLGLVAASLTCDTRHVERPLPGVRGASIFSASFLYFGFLDFWNTAQSELWYALLGIASVWAVTRIRHEARAQLVGGLLAGAAIFMKPPSVWFTFIALAMLVLRVREQDDLRLRRAARGVAIFSAGAAAIAVLVLGYFAAHGALGAMFDVVVRANAYYVMHESGVDPRSPVVIFIGLVRIWSPIAPVFALSLAAAVLHGYRCKNRAFLARHLLATALLLAGFVAYVMQGKFYLLHGVALVPPSVVVAANLAADCCLIAKAQLPRLNGALVFTGLCLFFYPFTPYASQGWWDENEGAVSLLAGRTSRDEFNAIFQIPSLGFSFQQSARVANWLRDHTQPDDFVAVRGFQAEMYAVAERRYPGRFFWTTFLTAPSRAYRREEWLAEDLAVLQKHPPRYVVTRTSCPDGCDSTPWFEARGYHVVTTIDDFTILQRDANAR